jgi:hypothetical protein
LLALKEISLEVFEREGESYNDSLHLLKKSSLYCLYRDLKPCNILIGKSELWTAPIGADTEEREVLHTHAIYC